MEIMDFEAYMNELKEADLEDLERSTIMFFRKWEKNEFLNEFNYKREKNEFLDEVVDKIIELDEYPSSLHRLMLKNLQLKQLMKITSNINLTPQYLSDYLEKYIDKGDMESCITLAKVPGVDVKRVEKAVIQSRDARAMLKFAQAFDDVDYKSMLAKLAVLMRKKTNAMLFDERERAYKKINELYSRTMERY